MWRKQPHSPPLQELHPEAFASSRERLHDLIGRLREVFRFVEPSERNSLAHGPQIAELLITACTEVESASKAVLRINGYRRGGHWNMRDDYVKLVRPLRLNEWTLRLSGYPEYPEIAPFGGWGTDAAGQVEGLPWYKAYNALKHDRETKRDQGTLAHAISAVVAAETLVVAQFGPDSGSGVMRVVKEPRWSARELYFPPDDAVWNAVNFKFPE